MLKLRSREREMQLEIERLRKQVCDLSASGDRTHSAVEITYEVSPRRTTKEGERDAGDHTTAGGEEIEQLSRKQELIAEIFESEQENLRAENRKLRRLLLQGASQDEVRRTLESGPCAMTLDDISLLIEQRLQKHAADARSEGEASRSTTKSCLRRNVRTEVDEELGSSEGQSVRIVDVLDI